MSQLCSQEEERYTAALKIIAEQAQSYKERVKKSMLGFLVELAKLVKSQLHTMDTFVYPSEITGEILRTLFTTMLHRVR